MVHDHGIAIHFSDSTSLDLSFPRQTDNPYAAQLVLEDVIKRRVLTVEADGALYVIPFENVKYFTVHPVGEDSTIKFVIRGATAVG